MKTFVNEKYFIWLYWSGTDNYDDIRCYGMVESEDMVVQVRYGKC